MSGKFPTCRGNPRHVGGIPDKADQETLVTHLEQFGTIVVWKAVLETRGEGYTGYKGIGYVQFKFPEDLERAKQHCYYTLGSRTMVVEESDREFDVDRITRDRGGIFGTDFSVRAPRVNVLGSIADNKVFHAPDGEWFLPPAQWQINVGVWDPRWKYDPRV